MIITEIMDRMIAHPLAAMIVIGSISDGVIGAISASKGNEIKSRPGINVVISRCAKPNKK